MLGLGRANLANRREDGDEDDEGRRVEQEEGREAAGIACGRDQPADDATQAKTQVHADSLQREGRVGPLGRGEAREQSRLTRPEAGGARSLERQQRERLPRLADQREERKGNRLEQQAEQQRVPPTEAVDDRAGSEAGRQGGDGAGREGEARCGERDPAHVVQVDDDEREHDPVPQGVDDSAALDEPDLPRQERVEAA